MRLLSTIGTITITLLISAGVGSVEVCAVERQELMLQGYPLLSQRDPANYRDTSLMTETDTANQSGRDIVANLACLAAVYTMIERGRGRGEAMIDDFYPRPSEHGGQTNGPPWPKYVSDETPVSRGKIVDELVGGHPVILRGKSTQVPKHFVLAIGLKRSNEGRWLLIALDPWPGKGKEKPGYEIEINLDAEPMKSVGAGGIEFAHMRRVTGFTSKVIAPKIASVDPQTANAPDDVIAGKTLRISTPCCLL